MTAQYERERERKREGTETEEDGEVPMLEMEKNMLIGLYKGNLNYNTSLIQKATGKKKDW